MARRFKAGDVVVYRKPKFSARPGPHAVEVAPAPGGDLYSYCVDKYWRVLAVRPDGKIEVCTRRGKRHAVDAADPALRPASWWDRLFCRHRFPAPPQEGQLQVPPGPG
jgi:hypothetical protein